MISKKRLSQTLYTVLCVAGISACATSQNADSSHVMLKDSNGMTYYTFDKDAAGNGKSACYGSCSVKWPPVPSSASTGSEFDSITRKDGSKQLTYQGNPVYYFAGDTKSSERNGDGLGGVWHIVHSNVKTKTTRTTGSGSYSSSYDSY